MFGSIYSKIVSGPPPLGFVERRLWIWLLFIPVIFIVQRYWLMRARRSIRLIGWPRLKALLAGVWFAAVLMLSATVFDMYFWRFLPHRFLSDWLFAGVRLWLVASTLGYVSLKLTWAAGRIFTFLFLFLSGRGENKVAPRMRAGAFKKFDFDPDRRRFLHFSALLAGGAPFFLTAYGFGDERLGYRIERVQVPIPGLPAELEGLRILQLSDIHRSDFLTHYELRRAVDMANGLCPDLAVITGDFISYKGDPLEDCVAELGRLRAPLGVWGCNGNHETYAGVEGLAQKLFRKNGMRLLRQENAVLAWRGGKQFNLIGVDYQSAMDPLSGKKVQMLREIEPMIRKDIPNILLSHNPNSFYRAAELGIELSLAGHTHGGQIDFDILHHNLTPARLFTKFVAGLYRLPFGGQPRGGPSTGEMGALEGEQKNKNKNRTAALYVNRGLGTFGIPVRIGAPPEITLMVLRRA